MNEPTREVVHWRSAGEVRRLSAMLNRSDCAMNCLLQKPLLGLSNKAAMKMKNNCDNDCTEQLLVRCVELREKVHSVEASILLDYLQAGRLYASVCARSQPRVSRERHTAQTRRV